MGKHSQSEFKYSGRELVISTFWRNEWGTEKDPADCQEMLLASSAVLLRLSDVNIWLLIMQIREDENIEGTVVSIEERPFRPDVTIIFS